MSIQQRNNFVNNKIVKDYITSLFDKEYNAETCPKWVNFEMFKEEKITTVSNALFECMVDDDNDGRKFWGFSLALGYTSISIQRMVLFFKEGDENFGIGCNYFV